MSNKEKPIDDELVDYMSLNKYLEDDTERKKNRISNEIEEMGDTFITEIEQKRKRKSVKQRKLIPYILNKTSNIYDEKELLSYSYEDVLQIYNEVKNENQSIIVKIFHFIFGLE